MGKKKDKRQLEEMTTPELDVEITTSPIFMVPTGSDNPVAIVTFLTEADRFRLKGYALEERTSLQRMGHRAWNAFLASHNLPGLTPVLQGKVRNKRPKG